MSSISSGTTLTTALVQTADTSGVLQLQTNGTTTAVTIDTAQNAGFGVTPSAWGSTLKAIQIGGSNGYISYNNTNGGYLYWNMYNDGSNNKTLANGNIAAYGLNTSGQHVWFNGTGTTGATSSLTQAMTLDASGNLLVGTTSGTSRLTVSGTAGASNVRGVGFFNSITSGDLSYAGVSIVKYDNNQTTSQVYMQFSCNTGALGNGQINGNGSNAAAFGSYSDSRLKENITDLPSQLNNITSLRPVEFDYIESEGGGHQVGFIAQEMQEVYPDVVGERPDGMLTITGWSKTEARLVKAIQELSAQVTTLQTQVTALQSKG